MIIVQACAVRGPDAALLVFLLRLEGRNTMRRLIRKAKKAASGRRTPKAWHYPGMFV